MRVITGTCRGRRLLEPVGRDVRPTADQVKEAMFNIIQFDVEGRKVLDLFAGTGQLGIEALSRGAAECLFVDSARDSVRLVQENLRRCGLAARVLQCDALGILKSGEKFDLIFLDPPYGSGLEAKAIETVKEFDILSRGGIMVVETRPETAGIRYDEDVPLRENQTHGHNQRKQLMQTAICPGSFDPITLGHLDVIRRASKMFERVVVCVVANPGKHCAITLEERCEQVRRVTASIPNVEVDMWEGLLVDYADRYENPVVVRGLRALSDFEYEFMMALTNKKLNSRVETVFLASDERYMYLSSTTVREIASYGGDISRFVPAEILDDLMIKLNGRK